jgi:hypothetical protein
MDQALFQELTAFYERLKHDDASAKSEVRRLKERAKAGDRAAQLHFNTLAALHWEKGEATWQKADAFYQKLVQEAPEAWDRLKWIKAHTGSPGELGDRCKDAFAMVKAVHKHYHVSVWYPGAPKIGGYPMPNMHRAGIEIGAAGDPITSSAPALDYATANHLLGLISAARSSLPLGVQAQAPGGQLRGVSSAVTSMAALISTANAPSKATYQKAAAMSRFLKPAAASVAPSGALRAASSFAHP